MILLVRHGRAEDRHPQGDGARGLTEEGRREFRASARGISARTPLAAVATSPLPRAVQTAEILAEACGLERVVVRVELGLGAAPADIEALARELGRGFALVGHNPSMSAALAWLLGREAGLPRFAPGAAAALDPGATLARPWSLAWTASPGAGSDQ